MVPDTICTDINVPASNRTRPIVKAASQQRTQMGSSKEGYLTKCAIDSRCTRAEAQPNLLLQGTARHCKALQISWN